MRSTSSWSSTPHRARCPCPTISRLALAAEPDAERFFGGLTYSQQRWFVLGIEDAKTAETRQRRISAAVARLREGRGQR